MPVHLGGRIRPIRLRTRRAGVTMVSMSAVTISVQADSEAEAVAWLEKLRALGLLPLGRPTQVIGRDRWMVRAQPQPLQRHDAE